VKVARVGNLVQALQALKARGIWVVGFDAAGSERWDAVDLTKPVALVLGGEGRGIRRLVREHCDHLVSIPHFGHIGSLNVSVAAGIALYEVVRQRRSVPSGVRPIPARPHAPQIVGPAPDDAETDPGARPAQPIDGDDPASDVAAASVRHVDLSDDVAWGQGPVVLKPIGFDRPHRVDDRRRKGRRHRPPGQERRGPPPAASANGPGLGPGDEREGREGREGPNDGGPPRKGRRRRRRGRRDGAPGSGPPPTPGVSRGPEAVSGPGPERPGGQEGSPAGGGGGRKRRRRRRH
jgi:hypothetical protein